MKRRIILSGFLLPCLLASCVGVATQEYAATEVSRDYYDDGLALDSRGRTLVEPGAIALSPSPDPGTSGTQDPRNGPDAPARVLVYTGSMVLAVPDPEVAIERASALAAELEGYVDWIVDASIQLRVPATRWEEALERCRSIGVVTNRRIEVRDVGKQLVDLELRLENQRALLDRLRALLEKAEDVKAALEVERELARVQTEVEQLEAQLQKLRQQIAYSSLTLTFQRTVTSEQARRHLPFPWIHELSLENLLGREVSR